MKKKLILKLSPIHVLDAADQKSLIGGAPLSPYSHEDTCRSDCHCKTNERQCRDDDFSLDDD